jgi:MFS family permease
VGAALVGAFVLWERRVVARNRQPLLDIRLLTGTPGYASGAALGLAYFVGFSGIWLVFALYFQNGLGYTPLQSGLAVTSFALGSAASAVVGGWLVERFDRLLTVVGLTMVVVGLAVTAIVLRLAPPGTAGWAVAAPLLLAGVGGGCVISPNTTMTLRCVPVHMAGSAGGALQTGQRIGSAIGTAALAGVFYAVLDATGTDFPVAVSIAIGAAAVAVTIALAIGIGEWRTARARPVGDGHEHDVHLPDH